MIGLLIDENSFIKLASQKWAVLSIEEKAGFQVQWNKASDAEVEDDEGVVNKIEFIFTQYLTYFCMYI